ncbi:hypothetical protein D3C78_1611180 [compost metagenome]
MALISLARQLEHPCPLRQRTLGLDLLHRIEISLIGQCLALVIQRIDPGVERLVQGVECLGMGLLQVTLPKVAFGQ